jgi:hypothetical protein
MSAPLIFRDQPCHALSTFVGEAPSRLHYLLCLIYRPQGFILCSPDTATKPTLDAEMPLVGLTFVRPDDPLLKKGIPWQGMHDFTFYCRDNMEDRACSTP